MKYWSNYSRDKTFPETYDAPLEEEKTLKRWEKDYVFKNPVSSEYNELTNDSCSDGTQRDKKKLSILWGPPFPTGLPHYGHLLNSVVKDVFIRHAIQKGRSMEVKFGWDCHGIPVEYEVSKKLKHSRAKEAEGQIWTFNKECKKFVIKQQEEWTKVFSRVGNLSCSTTTYSTMSKEYMESVWNIFKELYDKGLVYKGKRVLPYSTTCTTYLSDFEAELNVKEITDLSITFSLALENSPAKLLVHTPNPWMILGSMALAVNPKSIYIKVQLLNNQVYVLSKGCLANVFKDVASVKVLNEFPGIQLIGLRYKPLFTSNEKTNTFQMILNCEKVQEPYGTGIIILSPFFSNEDYTTCLENGLDVDEQLCPLDDNGRFKSSLIDFSGLTIEETNMKIVETLQASDQFVATTRTPRKQSLCWRSDHPLINKLTTTLFLRTEHLLADNIQPDWPFCNFEGNLSDHVSNIKDWPIGRNKFWGTPIPLWMSESGDETRCIGSASELSNATGHRNIPDLHREYIDQLVIPSNIPDNPALRRIPLVFDCWFESAIIAYANTTSETDLIIEGLDQTHGWFYTLWILSKVLERPLPTKRIFAHGLMCDTDGTKFSKRKHNRTDPGRMIKKYGADALRIALLSSPAVVGKSYNIEESDVRFATENVLQPFYDIVKKLLPRFGKSGWVTYGILQSTDYIKDPLNIWLLSRAESLIQLYDEKLEGHKTDGIISQVVSLLKDFRERYPDYWSCKDDVTFAMYNVVYRLCIVLSPFAPFFTDTVYQLIKPFTNQGFYYKFMCELILPVKCLNLLVPDFQLEMSQWIDAVDLVHLIRKHIMIPIEYRAQKVVILQPIQGLTEINDEKPLYKYLIKVMNAKEIQVTNDQSQMGVNDCTWDLREYFLQLDQGSPAIITQGTNKSEIDAPSPLAAEQGDVQRKRMPAACVEENTIFAYKNGVIVAVFMNQDLQYYQEGTRLALVNSIGKCKVKANLYPSEHCFIRCNSKADGLKIAVLTYAADIQGNNNLTIIEGIEEAGPNAQEVMNETFEVKGVPLTLFVYVRK